MFFHFRQNNSGGSFHNNPDAGISVNVIVEADDADHANRRAEKLGLYFGGAGDCRCCGDRWSEQWDDRDGDLVPSVYGDPIQDYDFEPDKWIYDGPEAYVHFADGLVQGYGLPRKSLA
ncbi:hypothetical protein KME66_14725 [Streptomyces sp. YPW6]|uniref:DUF7296 family protein n=1 Tax=Streptomyces sp. YPW6 TaxID=2840373 RepID=UPI001C0D50A9|nr:hypothetical protein [Streptomyces sp. YPW6]QWQ42124.1 hypothetical protein KME66_14725 [Streptomyces sp. YPW6]